MGLQVVGVDEAANQLNIIAKTFEPGVRRVITQGAEMARGHMQSRYLSGNPLNVRSGKLRSNWQVRTQVRGRDFVAAVGTNTAYAAAQNYGVKGVQQVKAHVRRSQAGGGRRPANSRRAKLARRSEARNAAGIRNRKDASARAGHGARNKRALDIQKRQERKGRGIQAGALGASQKAGKGMVSVRAHDRFMKIPGTFYVQRTLRDVAPRVQKLFQAFNQRQIEGRK